MKDYFTEGSSGVCVRNWKQAEYGFSKSHFWLKTKLWIDSEILRIDPESLERESRWIFFFSTFNVTPEVFSWD